MADAGTVYVNVRGDVAGLMGDIDGAARKATGTAGNIARTVIGDVGRVAAQTVAGFSAIGAVGATALIKVGAGYNTLEQSSLAAFKTLLGTEDAAIRMQESLREFAKSSPFPRQAFIEGTQQLLAFGFEAEKVIPTLDAIQDSVAAAGGSTTDLSNIVEILAKIRSSASFSVADLNQFGTAGINAARLIGEELGVTEEQFRDSLFGNPMKGQEAVDAIDALVRGMSNTFGGAADDLKNTYVGAVDRIRGAFRDIGSDLIEPFISKSGGGYAVIWANELATSMRNLQATVIPALEGPIESVAARFSEAAEAAARVVQSIDGAQVQAVFGRISTEVGKVRDTMRGLEGVAVGTGIAIAGIAARSVLGPLGFLVPAISPVTGVLGGLVAGSKEGRDALVGLGEQAGRFARGSGAELVRSFGSFVEQIEGPVARAITTVSTALFDVGDVAAPLLGRALEQLGGPLGDLIESGSELVANVLTAFTDIAGSVLPPALTVLGSGVQVVADVLGVLAENAWLVVPALGALAAAKAWGTLSTVGTTVAEAGRSFLFLKQSIDGIAATQGVSRLQALQGALVSSRQEGLGLTKALGGINLAMVGVTAAVGAGAAIYSIWRNNIREVEQAGDQLWQTLSRGEAVLGSLAIQLSDTFDREGTREAFEATGLSIAAVSAAINENVGQVDEFRQSWNDAGKSLIIFRREGREIPEGIRPIIENLLAMAEAGQLTGEQLNDVIDVLVDVDKNARQSADGFAFNAEQLEKVIPAAKLTADVMRDLATAQDTTAGLDAQQAALQRLAAQFPELAAAAGVAVGEVSTANGKLADESRRAVNELQALAGELANFSGSARNVDEAQRRLNESVDRVTQSFLSNGAGIDKSTEAGRSNADAIQRAVEASERLAEAQAKTDTSGELSRQTLVGITVALTEFYEQGLLTKEEYENLLRIYALTPSAIDTRVNADTNQAQADIQALDQRINELTGVYEPAKAELRAQLLRGEYEQVESELNLLTRDRIARVRLEAVFPTGSIFGNLPGAQNFPLQSLQGARARGGPVWPGDWLVGENGPEILRLSGAQRGEVINAKDTRQMLAPSGGISDDRFDRMIAELQAMRGDLAAIDRPLIGVLNQNGQTAETSPESMLLGVKRARAL